MPKGPDPHTNSTRTALTVALLQSGPLHYHMGFLCMLTHTRILYFIPLSLFSNSLNVCPLISVSTHKNPVGSLFD